jgi:hypothetical protein
VGLSEDGLHTELEPPRPLSQSLLWRLHEEYFERQGVQAWSSGDVPHQLTTGPLIARAYAEIVEGVLADCAEGRFGHVDPAEPLFVLELGAGIGRLAHGLLHVLAEPGDGAPRVVYVLSDATESTLAFWRTHPRLRPLLDAGRLDLARYGVGSGEPLVLERSGRVLAAGSLANPLVVIANYLFDVLRQDLFVIDGALDGERRADGAPAAPVDAPVPDPGTAGGERRRPPRLYEELVGVLAPAEGHEPGTPGFLHQLLLETERVPVPADRYADPEVQSILEEIAAERAEDAPARFLFPVAAIAGVRDLLALAGGRIVLLLGERPGEAGQPDGDDSGPPAVGRPEPGAGAGDGGAVPTGATILQDDTGATRARLPPGVRRPARLLEMGVHGGSISLPVDLDILSRAVRRRGGELLLPEASPAGLLIGAFIAGDGGRARATRRRFRLAIDEGGPEDLFLSLRAMLDRGVDDLPLSMALALLRVGGYDPFLFRRLHPRLAQLLPEAEAAAKEEALRVVREVWERFYPLDDRTDLAFAIAGLLAPAGCIAGALEFLGYSRDFRPTALASYNIALCHLLLGDERAARDAVEEALSLDPQLEDALALRRRLEDSGIAGARAGPAGSGR